MVAVSVSAEIGARRPLHCTAVGKVYLAALPDGERRTILRRITLTAYTPRTITSTAEAISRRLGYAPR